MQSPFEREYAVDPNYWGKQPSSMAKRLAALVPDADVRRPTLLDLACGQGRDTLYLASLGFNALGYDISQSGVDAATTAALAARLDATFVVADLNNEHLLLPSAADTVLLSGALHYVRADVRPRNASLRIGASVAFWVRALRFSFYRKV